jgi:hypothetical protein
LFARFPSRKIGPRGYLTHNFNIAGYGSSRSKEQGQVPTAAEKREKLAMMSDVFRRVYERKHFESAQERNLFLDKMVAWFDRLFDAWQEETMSDLKDRLRGLGVKEKEVNDAIAQIEAGLPHKSPKRPVN